MNEAPPSEDTGLMRRVQAGDESALGTLMDRWELPVKSLLGRILLNWREADDLAQESFVRLWQQRHRFDPQAEFRPWLFAIAINLARNRLRWWKRRPEVALEDWTPTEELAVAAGATMPASPAGVAERVERAAAVRAAIAALPPELREVIVLFEYEQLSHQEIGAALGCTPKAVESRLYRAREKLRRQLSGWSEAVGTP